ncbi:ABC transporter substrate-binding protein [Cumulibacter soli]|uniref:ABC transporter substrate-binding protein n=1 Tax=Cumulibacter soli TaxID=2546344 RepID=UPI001419FA88|nr:extracellular solute-binding protein [Cumulibacter soli]
MTKLRSRKIVAAVLPALSLPWLTACGSDEGGGGSIDLASECGIDQEVLDKATEEGQVVYFSPSADDQLQRISQKFNAATGIEVSVNRQPTGDLIQQVDTSLEAGTVPADVVGLAEPSGFIKWTDEGVLEEFEVPNADDFVDGLKDPNRYSYPNSLLLFGIQYNETLLEGSVPETWDALSGDLDGRIVAFGNPASSGSALAATYGITQTMGDEYLATFAGADTTITDSSLTLNQLILTGEADFAVPGIESEVMRAASGGEPLKMIYPEEGVPATTGEIGVLADAPHPNAGLVFAQWILCSAYQDQIKDEGYRPVLKDSPAPDGVPPLEDLTIVTVDVPDLLATRDEVIANFDEALG